MDAIVQFFLTGPGQAILPIFQGSFNLAYPPNADFPADLGAIAGATLFG